MLSAKGDLTMHYFRHELFHSAVSCTVICKLIGDSASTRGLSQAFTGVQVKHRASSSLPRQDELTLRRLTFDILDLRHF